MDGAASDNEEVSGFYGPGSWAAWVIILASSWIPIYLHDYDSNTHFIVYALYMNWAAIDLIRHIHKLGSLEETQGDLVPQPTIAPGAVVSIGVLHALLQGIVCLSRLRDSSPSVKRKLQRRICIIHVGLILPISAFLYRICALPSTFIGIFVFMTLFSHGINTFSRVLHHCSGCPEEQGSWYASLVVPIILLVGFALQVATKIGHGKSSYDQGKIITPLLPSFLSDRCHYIPCAPQKIDEWDQLFALLVALTLFFYEFKERIFALWGRLSRSLEAWCTGVASSSRRTSPSEHRACEV